MTDSSESIEPAAREPLPQVVGGAQVLLGVVDVEGVDEVPDQLELAGRLLLVWLDFLYHVFPV